MALDNTPWAPPTEETRTIQPLGPNQERWLRALESGEWAQGHRRLCSWDPDRNAWGYCCLGVGEVVVVGDQGSNADHQSCLVFEEGQGAFAGPRLVAMLALYDNRGSRRSGRPRAAHLYAYSLAGLNDAGTSFAEISRMIRSDPSLYFREPR